MAATVAGRDSFKIYFKSGVRGLAADSSSKKGVSGCLLNGLEVHGAPATLKKRLVHMEKHIFLPSWLEINVFLLQEWRLVVALCKARSGSDAFPNFTNFAGMLLYSRLAQMAEELLVASVPSVIKAWVLAKLRDRARR